MANETSDDILKKLHEYERTVNPQLQPQAKRYLHERDKMRSLFKDYVDKRQILSQKYIEKCIEEGGKDCYCLYDAKDISKRGKPRRKSRQWGLFSSKTRAENFIKALKGSEYEDCYLPKDPVIMKIKASEDGDAEHVNLDFVDEGDEYNLVDFSKYIVENGPFEPSEIWFDEKKTE